EGRQEGTRPGRKDRELIWSRLNSKFSGWALEDKLQRPSSFLVPGDPQSTQSLARCFGQVRISRSQGGAKRGSGRRVTDKAESSCGFAAHVVGIGCVFQRGNQNCDA